MQITLTSHACNHLLRLAQGLQSQNYLNRFYTIYPQFKLDPYQIEKQYAHSIRFIGASIFAARKLKVEFPDQALSSIFDNYVALALRFNHNQSDIVQGNSGFCLETIKAAKNKGMKTIVDRACPHIDFQLSLLDEEVERLTGKKYQMSSGHRLKDKMIAEYEASDAIIVPSNYSYNSFIQKGFDQKKLHIVPLMKEKNVTRLSPQKDKKLFTVLAVGFSFYRKGFYYLLKAWNELNLPNAQLIIRNVVPEEFQHLCQLKSVVAVNHHLSNDELIRLYQDCDVFCLPSIDEGFGMAAVEAMAAGKPLIVTNNVGMSDIITDKKEGFVLPIRNVDAIKESILTLYDDRDLMQKMGEAAYLCEQQYSQARYIQTITSVYRQLISQ